MSTEHKFVITFAKVERHRVEGVFPGHPSNRKNDEMIIKVQYSSRYPIIVNRVRRIAGLTYMCGFRSPSSLKPSCEVTSRKLSTLIISLWVRFKTFVDLKYK